MNKKLKRIDILTKIEELRAKLIEAKDKNREQKKIINISQKLDELIVSAMKEQKQ